MAAFLAYLFTSPITILFRAFVLTKIWSWYIVTGFALAPLSMYHAFGLSLVVGFLTFTYVDNDPDNKKDTLETILGGAILNLFVSALCLFWGWIGTLFA